MLAWWDGWLVLWGGTTEDESIWVYDPTTRAWGRVDSTGPSARSGFAWDTVEDDPWAVVIGGATSSQDDFLSDVWVLNLDTLTWTEIKRLNDASF